MYQMQIPMEHHLDVYDKLLALGSLIRRLRATHTKRKETFSLLLCLDATKSVFLSVVTLMQTICLKILPKAPPQRKQLRPPPVDVRAQNPLCLLKKR